MRALAGNQRDLSSFADFSIAPDLSGDVEEIRFDSSKSFHVIYPKMLYKPVQMEIYDYLTHSFEISASPSPYALSRLLYVQYVSDRVVSRLKSCYSAHYFSCPEHPFYGVVSRFACKCRVCKNCRKFRQRILYRKYYPRLFRFRHARFMTLTYRDHSLHLERSIVDQINRSFKVLMKRMRRHGYIVNRYLKVLEVKNNDAGWFYHVHVIYEGSMIDHSDLMEFWHHATNFTSFVVDITPVINIQRASSYITKYLKKSVELDVTPEEYASLYGVQFYSSYRLPRPIYEVKFPNLYVCLNCSSRLKYSGSLANISCFFLEYINPVPPH